MMEPRYAQIVTERPVERFLHKLALTDVRMEGLVLVSPWIGRLEGRHFGLDALCHKVDERRIPTYVVTREPQDEYHREAVRVLQATGFVELRFNPAIHAKLYVCLCRDMRDSFALFGSGNLTWASIHRNIEIGMMIFGYGQGRDLIQELYYWGSVRLRMLPESRLVKRIQPFRGG